MDDLVPVFEIESSSMIADDDADEMESAIVQNQDMLAYWTNFDSWIDWVTLLFWIGGVAMIAMGMVGAGNASTESDRWPPLRLLKKKPRRMNRLRAPSDARPKVGEKGRKSGSLPPAEGGRTYSDSNNRSPKGTSLR